MVIAVVATTVFILRGRLPVVAGLVILSVLIATVVRRLRSYRRRRALAWADLERRAEELARLRNNTAVRLLVDCISTPRPFALYLRSFDEVSVLRRGPSYSFFKVGPEATMAQRVEESIAEALGERLPVVALVNPLHPMPYRSPCAAEIRVASNWQEVVTELIARAAVIIVRLGSEGPGVSTEVREILRSGRHRATLVIYHEKNLDGAWKLVEGRFPHLLQTSEALTDPHRLAEHLQVLLGPLGAVKIGEAGELSATFPLRLPWFREGETTGELGLDRIRSILDAFHALLAANNARAALETLDENQILWTDEADAICMMRLQEVSRTADLQTKKVLAEAFLFLRRCRLCGPERALKDSKLFPYDRSDLLA